MGPLSILQILFITLKVLELISWSWWLVFVPTYISAFLFLFVMYILVKLK